MEEVKQAVQNMAAVYKQITQLLATTNPQVASATYDMEQDGSSVNAFAIDVIGRGEFNEYDVKSVSGLHRSFGRHLSEVEQTVYEEIGGERLDQLMKLYDQAVVSYKQIWDYLSENNLK